MVESKRRRRGQTPHGFAVHRRVFLGALAALVALSIGVFTDAPQATAVPDRLILSAPITPFTVERLTSLPQQPWLAGHRGLDLVAHVGEPITAPATGVITFVGFVVDRPLISIRHDQGLVSSFEPIDSTAAVGDVVARGKTIGTVADARDHCARSQCVHGGLRLDGTYVDPLDYLEGFGPVRLLPPGGD